MSLPNFREYQLRGLEHARQEIRQGNRRVAVYGPTGCHGRGERVLRADGSTVESQDVAVGDLLMGDDGRPVTVMGLHRGRQAMAVVTPVKGEPFRVNIDHLLSLVHTETGCVIDVSVLEWLNWSPHRRHLYKLRRCPVPSFGMDSALPIHPWLLGVIIGDGCLTHGVSIANPEPRIQAQAIALAEGVAGKVLRYAARCDVVALTNPAGVGNPLLVALRALGLYGKTAHGKFIPDAYRLASMDDRRRLLAGLLDTDGHLSNGGYDFITASAQLADDVVFVARSVGLAAYRSLSMKFCQTGAGGQYYRVSISGDFSEIPTVKHPPFARQQKKDVRRTGFSVSLVGEDEYFGWEVDGNHRYLDATFTAHHNSGKTVLGLGFIVGALNKGKRVAFLANRIHLIKQASEQFSRAGIDHGIIQGSNTFGTHKLCIVASIQTVARRGLPPSDLIVIDEAHGVPGSKDYLKLLYRNNNVVTVGLSATPFSRGMGKKHAELNDEPLFQSLVVTATIRELIDLGYLVDCDIYAPAEEVDLSKVKKKRNAFGEMDYDEQALAEVMNKPKLVGDLVGHWLQRSKGSPTVVFATDIAHSKAIVEKFEAAGVRAGHLDGYMNEEERGHVLGRLARGEITVLSNVAVLREGWDFPACATMILARPTKSLIAWIQMCGRILRPHPGKDRAVILDHSGSVHELGYPTDDLPLELDDGTAKAGTAAKKQEERLPKKCPSCGFLKAPGQHRCPQCGFSPERQAKDVEVGEGSLEAVKRKKAPAELGGITKQQAYSELIAIRAEKGYSHGWVAHKYRAIFGVWPKGLHDSAAEPSPELRQWVRGQQIRHAIAAQKAAEKDARHAA